MPSRPRTRVGRGGATLRVPGGGEHPPPCLACGDVQSWLSPKGPPSPLWLLEEASAPPCSAQPHSLGSEPGQGRGGCVCYRIWGDGVSLPKLSKLKQEVLSSPTPVLPGARRAEQMPSPLGLPDAEGGTTASGPQAFPAPGDLANSEATNLCTLP